MRAQLLVPHCSRAPHAPWWKMSEGEDGAIAFCCPGGHTQDIDPFALDEEGATIGVLTCDECDWAGEAIFEELPARLRETDASGAPGAPDTDLTPPEGTRIED